nr:immunoglobulin heavy chain junction region [Macaca mulatta]MOW76450.1 immunoglobulin heavy chain junction region [Macaca mulatta]MOW76886.1 immunoglobulin heavy chain junction region [Macaca mulatta]MOW78629.1 immunoglobulin heavy chain junction region [Macaca mulatta]MOW78657.1 immunoglobulin heavy chain junction region [Macaca mulatta]
CAKARGVYLPYFDYW